MQKIFASVIKPRIASEVGGDQVNFCKNPLCTNYGLAASSLPQKGKNAIANQLLLRVKASLFLNALAVVNTRPLKASSVSMKSVKGFLII